MKNYMEMYFYELNLSRGDLLSMCGRCRTKRFV
ncbi:CLUMA_CG016357, isoform A [Clunio marinus]|uniref:CLUMA_CG016357, isoform A n=1 Tax=Clunio marinus TaxID=568069 RepID=A0A1J1IT94_9DIPT|nr:CLUMA_CG016357, isoform A [Clunio marinus]